MSRRSPPPLSCFIIFCISRRRRIARGAGVQVQDVNRLMKQFLEMQKMMKQLKGGGLRRLMGAFKGGAPQR